MKWMSQTSIYIEDQDWPVKVRWPTTLPLIWTQCYERQTTRCYVLGNVCRSFLSMTHTLNLVRREILQMIQKSYRTTDFLQLYSILFPLPAITYLWSDKLSLKRRTIEYRFLSNVNQKKREKGGTHLYLSPMDFVTPWLNVGLSIVVLSFPLLS